MPRVNQQGDALPRPGDRFIHLLRLPVPAAALHIAMQKMVRDRVQHCLGRLRTGGVIEKNEIVLQRGERGANLVYGEISHVAL
jgi:hypothetical protein